MTSPTSATSLSADPVMRAQEIEALTDQLAQVRRALARWKAEGSYLLEDKYARAADRLQRRLADLERK